MGLNKYSSLKSARMALYNKFALIKDLAIVELSTSGHGVYNYGDLAYKYPTIIKDNLYSTSINEVEISIGLFTKVENAIKEAISDGYKNIFLLPSSLVLMLGIDLNLLANKYKKLFDINIFTINIKMHETYYSGICKFYDYLKTLNCSDSNKILNSYAIIGGENSIANYNKKLEVKKLINTYFNCKCLLIDSNNIKLEDYLKLSKVQFIIITSLSALKLAENLKERYGINYFYFNSINYQSINKTLNNISTTLNIQFKKKGLLKINTDTFNQINNVLHYSNPKILIYADEDNLNLFKDYFELFNYTNVTYYSMYESANYQKINADELIDKYKKRKVVIISSDTICKYFKKSIAINYDGLTYNLVTDIDRSHFSIDSFYEFSKKLIKEIF